MPRFAANLGYLFPEHDFLDRFAAARAAGFRAVEFAAPYAHAPRDIADRLRDNGLECILFNLPMGPPGACGIGCRPERAARVIEEVGAPNFGLQCDLYHSAMMGDDPSSILSSHRGIIRHIQFADVPGRHEPGTGKLDFAQLFGTIDRFGYEGWVSAEYRPSKATAQTLHWFRPRA